MPLEFNSDGIITQSLSDILDEREEALRTVMGEDFTIDKDSPIGNMELADANSELTIQELLGWMFPSQLSAKTATGVFLDWICEKNRIYRRQPKATTLKLVINGVAGTELKVNDITVTDEKTTGNNTVYYDLNEDITIGEDGTALAEFKCEYFGEYYPVSTSTFRIETPVVGVDSVEIKWDTANLSIGRETESDEQLRIRRDSCVQQTSVSTLGSIQANVSSLEGVKYCSCFENFEETEDNNGLPPKSFEIIVDGGDETEITDAIFNSKPVGSRAFGNIFVEKYDSEGNKYKIGYTRAEGVDIGIKMHIILNTTKTQELIDSFKKSIIDRFESTQK